MTQSSAFDAILVQGRDLFRDRLCAAMGLMFDGAGEALSTLAEKTKEEELQNRYLDSRDLAAREREVIEAQFRSRYQADFQKRANQAKHIGTKFTDFHLDQLELVAEEDLNETLKFNDMAAKLRRYCEEELAALDQRVGVLLGDASLEADDNPFGPQVICDAYKHACRQVDAPVEVRMVLLKLFDDHVLDTIRASYKELNELLVENNILPRIRYGIAKHEDRAAAPIPAGAAPDAAAAPQSAPGNEQDMFAMLSRMLVPGAAGGAARGAAVPGMGIGGLPQVQGAELMSSLTQLQVGNLGALGEAAQELGPILAQVGNLKNVLREIKGTKVGASMGQVDAMTLDIVSMLFDELFEDPKIPIALKGIVGRLQLPILKVAIADKDLFTSKTHPARMLLDTLGRIGVRLPPDFDAANPLFQRIESLVQELVDGYEQDTAIFDKARGPLEAILVEDDQRVAAQMEATQKELERVEALAVAKAAAEDEIRSRVQAWAEAPRPVVEFLAQQWIKDLVIVHARDGAASRTWSEAVETIDQLLWSVAPKGTAEERRKLAGTIPSLLKRLKVGVAIADIEDATAAAFYAELMKCHTAVMRAPLPTAPRRGEKPGASAKPSVPAAAKPSPAADTAVHADLLDFSSPVTVGNPFGTGKVDVSSDDLDFTDAPEAPALAPPPAAAADAPRPAKRSRIPAIHLPAGIVAGTWVEILTDAGSERREAALLQYVSPKKSHFLFVDRRGNKVYECSRSMLARRLKLGEIALLEGEPDASLFDRILEGLFGKLKSKAPESVPA